MDSCDKDPIFSRHLVNLKIIEDKYKNKLPNYDDIIFNSIDLFRNHFIPTAYNRYYGKIEIENEIEVLNEIEDQRKDEISKYLQEKINNSEQFQQLENIFEDSIINNLKHSVEYISSVQAFFNDVTKKIEFKNLKISISTTGRYGIFGEFKYFGDVILEDLDVAITYLDENDDKIGYEVMDDFNTGEEYFNGKITGFGYRIDDQAMAKYAKSFEIEIIDFSISNEFRDLIPQYY